MREGTGEVGQPPARELALRGRGSLVFFGLRALRLRRRGPGRIAATAGARRTEHEQGGEQRDNATGGGHERDTKHHAAWNDNPRRNAGSAVA